MEDSVSLPSEQSRVASVHAATSGASSATTTVQERVGGRIRHWREKRGISQQVLAELTGLSHRWLIEIERGRADIKLSDLERLTQALRVDYQDVLSGEDPHDRPALAPRRAVELPRASAYDTRWGTRIGDLWFPWVVAGYGPYRPEHIESYFHHQEPRYPHEVESALQAILDDVSERGQRGEDVPFDSPGFKLLRFHVSSRTSREEPRLVLHFAPTTYFHMLATDQRLDVPETAAGKTVTLRERYAADVDLRVKPVSEFATHWGVGLAVVTSDRRLVISERGNTAVDAHVLFPSVAEGGHRDLDASPEGEPDHFTIARRGVKEELGIDLAAAELTWLSFGANAFLCEYGLIGRVDTPHSFAEIEQRRSMGAAKDSWETRRLHSVEFAPQAATTFLAQPGHRVSAFALATYIHALMSEFGVKKVEAAFHAAQITVSQHLPAWLSAIQPE